MGKRCCWWTARQPRGCNRCLVRLTVPAGEVPSWGTGPSFLLLTSKEVVLPVPWVGHYLCVLLSDTSAERGKYHLMGCVSATKRFKCWAKCHVFVVCTEQSPGKTFCELALTTFLSVGAKWQKGRLASM